MTLIWITLAFFAGCLFWHKFGGWLFKKFGMQESIRTDLLRNLSTDTLVVLMKDSKREFDRRSDLMERMGG